MRATSLIAIFLAVQLILPAAAGVRAPEPQDDNLAPPGYSIIASGNAALLVKRTENILILDVRSATAYERGHIKDAVNLDLAEQDFERQLNKLDSTKPILVYSDIDPPTNETHSVLHSAGFDTIIYLRDGFRGWQLNSLPIETGGEPFRFDSSARGID